MSNLLKAEKMKKILKSGVYALLSISLVCGMVSCSDDDPDYSNVTPPTVAVAPSQIAGMVSSMKGDAIENATVKATAGGKEMTAKTKTDGTFVLEGMAKGTYDMEVSADGKQTVTGKLTISKDGETAVYNAMLANAGMEVEVSETEETVKEMTTEVPEDNKEAEVTTEATIPAAALSDADAKIILTTVYTEDAVAQGRTISKATTRAAQSTMLMGMQLSCNKEGVVLDKPVSLSFDLGEEVAEVVTVKKNVNGNWQEVSAQKDGNKVVVDADEFGTYSVFADVDVTFNATTEPISFNNSEYDNLYGSKDLKVENVTYTYKQGGEIEKATGKLNAQLRQILANQIQGNKVTTVTGTYPVNVTLPVGTALLLSGNQKVETVTATCNGKSASGKVYGNVSVTATAYNRQHTGGSN